MRCFVGMYFGKMHACAVKARSQRCIICDQENKSARARNTAQTSRQNGAHARVGVPQNYRRTFGQHMSGSDRMGQTPFIRHENKRGQARIARVEPMGGSC